MKSMKLRLLFTLFAVFLPASALGQSAENSALNISNMHTHHFFWTVMCSSAIGWALGLTRGFNTSADWLKLYFPACNIIFVFLVDILIFVVVGAYVGTGLYNPTSFVSSMAAGITWPVGISALTSKADNK